jgi:CRISPR-associated protein Csm3
MEKLVKKIKIQTSITLVTGLHIGGSNDNVEIGGIDTPVIKLGSKGNQPYIPGSSLKGKMRCLLEQAAGIANVGDDGNEGKGEINNLFGITENEKLKIKVNKPSKLIVRDAELTKDSELALRSSDNLDMPYTESKSENTIDRVTAKANPRTIERVPAGAMFHAEFIINVWDDDKEEDLISLFKKGIKLLQNDYLGGNGSRGYGQIEFGELKRTDYSPQNNWNGETKESIKLN